MTQSPFTGGAGIAGVLDELAILKKALVDQDVLKIFNTQNPQKSAPLRNAKGQILQTRAIFDEGRGWMTKAGADETIRRIKKAGFNVYIPCVWHGQGTRYPSAIAQPEANVIFQEGDPFKYLIDIAHKNNIEIHPWFTVALRQREFLKEYYDEGTPNDAFNLHNPAFRQFIINLMVDVVERYKIDGINLDYIRTMGICKSSYCQDQYREMYARDLLDDLEKSNLNKRLREPVQNWIDNAVEDVVRNVSVRGKSARKSLIVSVDGHPIPRHMEASSQGRNEVVWANKGLIDVIFYMDYQRAPDYDRLDLVQKELAAESNLLILIANYEGNPKNKIIARKGNHLKELIAASHNA